MNLCFTSTKLQRNQSFKRVKIKFEIVQKVRKVQMHQEGLESSGGSGAKKCYHCLGCESQIKLYVRHPIHFMTGTNVVFRWHRLEYKGIDIFQKSQYVLKYEYKWLDIEPKVEQAMTELGCL